MDELMPPPPKFSDAARRCSDQIRLHIAMHSEGKWAAIRLSDGGGDGVPYDTRRDAIRHQLHEQWCAYVKIPYDDMPPAHAERFLEMNRELYEAGFRLVDPDDEHMAVMPFTQEDLSAALRHIRRYGR